MATITTHLDLAPELVTNIFSKVKGHSALASLCGADPIPFNGIEVMTFSMDGEAELVGEGDTKSPAKLLSDLSPSILSSWSISTALPMNLSA